MTPRDGVGRLEAWPSRPEPPGAGSASSSAAIPAWYDVTWNPTVGCSPVGPGCDGCEALRIVALLARIGGKSGARYAGLSATGRAGPQWTGDLRIREDLLIWPLRQRKTRRILVNSLSDLFHEKLATETVDAVHAVMAIAPWHRFLLLTRRTERMRAYYSDPQTPGRVAAQIRCLLATALPKTGRSPSARRRSFDTSDDASGQGGATGEHIATGEDDANGGGAGIGLPRHCAAVAEPMARAQTGCVGAALGSAALEPWPLPNLWLGVAVEDQQHAGRIADLLQTPAASRWVCFEPLLGPMRPDRVALGADGYIDALAGARFALDGRGRRLPLTEAPLQPLDWVVAGGETGAGSRATDPDWVRGLRDRCVAAAVPFFFRQWGEWAPMLGEDAGQKMVRRGRRAAGRLIDGRSWEEMPAALCQAAPRMR